MTFHTGRHGHAHRVSFVLIDQNDLPALGLFILPRSLPTLEHRNDGS
jgi:hypothetical protein